MTHQINNDYLIRLVIKWKYHLIIVVIAAVVLSAVASSSFFIKPKYKSWADLYPVNLIEYSKESPTEQMLQLLNSQEIRDKVFRDFKGADLYDLDTTKLGYYTILNMKYSDNITIQRTPNESVTIEVLAYDPKLASDMVDSIILYYNAKVRALHRLKALELVIDKKNILARVQLEIDSLQRQMDSLRANYGILDYNSQTERLTQGYVSLLSNRGSDVSTKMVNEKMKNLEDKGGDYLQLDRKLVATHEIYRNTKILYENALQEYNKWITYSQVVTAPFPADAKSYPIRWAIVFVSTIAAMLLALVAIGIIERYKYQSLNKNDD